MRKAGCISVIVLLMAGGVCFARTITVDDNGPADFDNIQAAINDASDGDTVLVKDGTYTGQGNHDIEFLGKAITVRSENGPENCITDCQNSGRGFYFQNGETKNSVVDGLTITNGYSDDFGSGIYCEQSSPTIINSTITNNWAYKYGGGIYCEQSSPTIINCTVKENMAGRYHGGGICCMNNSRPTIDRCAITDNVSGFRRLPGDPRPFSYHYRGGGIYCHDSSPTISRCIISDNWTDGNGSGIYCYFGAPTIKQSIITRNSVSGYGSGIYCHASELEIANCSIIGNAAGKDGGGVYCYDGNPHISNCIVWSNSTPQIVNCSFVTYSNIMGGWPGEGNISTSPLVTSNYHLLRNSPCVNAGDPTYSAGPGEKDIDGDPRVINGRVDMGADECTYEGPILKISPSNFEFYTHEGGPNPENQILSIYNNGTGTMSWQVMPDCPWLQVTPIDGQSTGEIDEVALSVDIFRLTPGIYNCQLTVTADGAVNSPKKISVILTIYDSDGKLYIPTEYPTFQAAINAAKDGDIVIVADGTYTGDGNRDIDFLGKAITVRSESGPENCIIDIGASQSDWHNGLYMHGTQDGNCIIEGFTMRGGYTYQGGAIFCDGSSTTIKNCVITKNTGGWGGGIACRNSNVNIYDCLICGNVGWDAAGGIYCRDSTVTIINSTITGNWADYAGGGIYCTGGERVITDCIIRDNWPQQIYPVSNYLSITYSNIEDGVHDYYEHGDNIWPDQGNIDADPCFVAAGYWDVNDMWVDGDYHLLSNSPCIDAGDPNYIPEPNETDLDGWPRVVNGRIDMGAYEYVPPVEVELKLTPQMLNCDSHGKWLKAHVTLPEEIYPEDIDVNTPAVANPPGIESEFIEVFESGRGRFDVQIYFDREIFCQALSESEDGLLEVTITGSLTDGRKYQGSDTIKLKSKLWQHRIRKDINREKTPELRKTKRREN